jgi:uncharacterized DUF497 family protein
VNRLLFEWAPEKAAVNQRKHGVTFEEAATVFADFLSRTMPDPEHGSEEGRFITIGCSVRERVLFVVHTDRGERFRLISARKANRKERIEYEESAEETG